MGRIVFLLIAVTGFLGAQVPQVDSVLNDASGIRNFSPGVRAIISGKNFGPPRSSSNSAPADLTVTMNQEPAEILGSSDTFIRVRFPIDLPNGSTNLVVSYQGGNSAGFFLSINAFSPGLYAPSFPPQLVNLTHPDQVNSASPGDLIYLNAVGLGATNPPAPLGSSFTFSNGPPTVATPLVTLAGKDLALISSTYVTGGLYAVAVRVPSNLLVGDYPVIVRIQGFNSNTVPLSVRLFGIVPTQTGITFSAVQGGGAPAGTNLPGIERHSIGLGSQHLGLYDQRWSLAERLSNASRDRSGQAASDHLSERRSLQSRCRRLLRPDPAGCTRRSEHAANRFGGAQRVRNEREPGSIGRSYRPRVCIRRWFTRSASAIGSHHESDEPPECFHRHRDSAERRQLVHNFSAIRYGFARAAGHRPGDAFQYVTIARRLSRLVDSAIPE